MSVKQNRSTGGLAKNPQGLFFYALLAIPACFAPLSIDLLMPALPAMAAGLAANFSDTQLSIYSFLLAYGLAPFVWGALSDSYGRKPLMVLGIFLFALTSFACAFAETIETLVALRFLQGFSAAAGIVLARAILRDAYGADGATRAIASLYLFLSLLPVAMPLAGGYLSAVFAWSDLFLLIAAVAAASLLSIIFYLTETLPSAARTTGDDAAGPRLVSTGNILSNRQFIRNAMTNMFAMLATVLFVSNYSLLSTDVYSVSAQQNGYILALYNLSLAGGIYIARLTVSALGTSKSMHIGITCLITGWTIVAALCAGAPPPMLLLMGFLMLASLGHGMIMALAPGQALIPFSNGAGKASAIFSCIQSVGASLISYAFVLWANAALASIGLALALCAVCSALCYYFIRVAD